MATVYMIHGYLGAGKTTFTRRLERHVPALRLTHDEWMLQLYGEDPPPSEFQTCFERGSERIAAVWTRCAELGLDVLLDLGFWSRGQRDQVRAIAAALGAETRLYRLSCPDDAAWARVERRNQGLTDSLFIARETLSAAERPLRTARRGRAARRGIRLRRLGALTEEELLDRP